MFEACERLILLFSIPMIYINSQFHTEKNNLRNRKETLVKI